MTKAGAGIYNYEKNSWKLDFRQVVSKLSGVKDIAQMQKKSTTGVCPACSGKLPTDNVPTAGGNITKLCDRCWSFFSNVTNRYARILQQIVLELQDSGCKALERLRPPSVGKNKAGDGSYVPLSIGRFIASITGKSVEHAMQETLHGHCPVCEEPHRVPAGKRPPIALCGDCRELHEGQNLWIIAAAEYLEELISRGLFRLDQTRIRTWTSGSPRSAARSSHSEHGHTPVVPGMAMKTAG